MTNALLYLELQSRANALRGWLSRLRQPRYALGSVAIAAYLWFLTRQMAVTDAASRPSRSGLDALLTGEFAPGIFFLLIAGGWFFGAERAALPFTEAEVAWLFPAPLSRRTLVHFRLLKSLVSNVFGALVYSALLLGAGHLFWHRFAGFWVLLSFHALHSLAGSFTRERLLARGLDVQRRRGALALLLIAIAAATWLWPRALGAPPDAPHGSGFAFVEQAVALLRTPPLTWVLAPFRIVLAPLRAETALDLLRAIWPALALLAAHYVWAMRAITGFEEASAALAEKRAATMRAMRGGRGLLALRKRKASSEPFALAPRGRPELAFLWSRLIAAGSWAQPRSLLTLAAIPIAAVGWMHGRPGWEKILFVVAIFSAVVAFYGLLLAPGLARGGFSQLFERIDLTKSYPLRGWQVALGELLAPIALLATLELTLITVAAIAAATRFEVPAPLLLAAWAAAALLMPPLVGLLFGTQLGLQLALPAWFQPAASSARFEAGGQGLLFAVGSVIVIVVALVPASLAASAAGGVAYFISDELALAVATGGLAAAAAVIGELALLLAWLGRRFERIDLANDLAR